MGAKTLEALTRPLTAEEIEWKIISSKRSPTIIAPYITARAAMARLDEAFGPLGWQVRYTPVKLGEFEGFIASILVKDPETGEWIEKQDGAGTSDLEPLKGGISGALKRAAVAWGIGRELYSYPRVYIVGEHKYIPRPVLERLKELPKAVAEGKPLPEVITLSPDGTSWRGHQQEPGPNTFPRGRHPGTRPQRGYPEDLPEEF